MDFFERQDKARKNTKLLVFYFVIAVICIVAAVYLACLLIFSGVTARPRHAEAAPQLVLWNPTLFLYTAAGTLLVIVCGSVFKTLELAQGGGRVAESLGGRLVQSNTTDPDERKLLNVVEEMALASGVPVPQVYVMDREMGINAFAAGHTPSDAAIGVTRGCMKLLKRDELQGVIGHEFSHILNGDMRLNMRLMGIIFGILCLAVIGRILLYSRTRSRDRNPLPLLGLALLVVGGVGVFFGRLIQAAVSRQREFLADASAVQFTRNPAGLAGALKKIGGLVYGSKLESPHASEASHMFFGNAVGASLVNAMATHPPLPDRIRAIDPHWDGRFAEVTTPEPEEFSIPRSQRARGHGLPPILPFPHAQMAAAAATGFSPATVRAQNMMTNVGQPSTLHLQYAEKLRISLPQNLQIAAHHPVGAVALVYTLLLSRDENIQRQQLRELEKQSSSEVYQATLALLPEVSPIAGRTRLPLVDLAMPALRSLDPEAYQQFVQTLKWLIESDRQIDLFEFVLQKIIRRHLETKFGRARKATIQFYSMNALIPDCGVVLSALAHVGQSDAAQAAHAFERGVPHLRANNAPLRLLPREQCGLAQIDSALNRLALAVPQIKKNLLEACVQVVGADGLIREHEAEMLRAIADTLDCPMPPFVETT